MKKITREEIDNRLQKLRESNLNEETYTMTRPAFAMCYSMAIPEYYTKTRKCDSCGKDFETVYRSDDDENFIQYEKALEKLSVLGLDARLACRCGECVASRKGRCFEIRVKAEDEKEYHVSYPKKLRGMNFSPYKERSDRKWISLFDLSLVQKFLTASLEDIPLDRLFDRLYNVEFREKEHNFFKDKPKLDFCSEKNLSVLKAFEMIKAHFGFKPEHDDRGFFTDNTNYIYHRFVSFFAERNSALTYKGINGENEVYDYENAGFIKTQIDLALAKVLGLVITYSKEEVIKNVELIYSQNEELKRRKSKVLQWVEEQWKEPFTVFDYSDFMQKANNELEKELEADI